MAPSTYGSVIDSHDGPASARASNSPRTAYSDACAILSENPPGIGGRWDIEDPAKITARYAKTGPQYQRNRCARSPPRGDRAPPSMPVGPGDGLVVTAGRGTSASRARGPRQRSRRTAA